MLNQVRLHQQIQVFGSYQKAAMGYERIDLSDLEHITSGNFGLDSVFGNFKIPFLKSNFKIILKLILKFIGN